MDYLIQIVPAVAAGLKITLQIFVITIVLSLPLGILMAVGRISKIAILRKDHVCLYLCHAWYAADAADLVHLLRTALYHRRLYPAGFSGGHHRLRL